MACSKLDVRFPKEWSKHHHNIGKEAVDEELLAEDELIDWLIAIDLCNKSTVKKYIEKCRPYHFMRCVAAVDPNNLMFRDIFKTYMHLLVGVYYSDDKIETYSSTEIRQIRDSYEMLDCQVFEQFPTIAKMKASLKINTKLMPHVILMVDFLNNIVHSLIQQDTISEDDLADYRRRISIANSMYFEAVEAEISRCVDDTNTEMLWRRIFTGGAIHYLLGLEAMLEVIGKVKAHSILITEMYVISALFCMLVNDIYSYHKEVLSKAGDKGDNIIIWMFEKKEVSEVPEAIQKIAEISNAIIKYMYQKVEKTKHEYPDNLDLHKLLDYIGMATVGWFFIHDSISCRYQDSPWRLSLVEVEEMELKEWRKCKDEEESVVLQRFLYHSSRRGKTLIDALCGSIKTRGHFVLT